MALVHITDHEARALARLIYKYREATNLRGLISAATEEKQTLEDLFWQMFTETIDTAEDAQLDVYGNLVGQPRGGRSDPVYRLWIRTRVLINRSSGTGTELLAIFIALVAGTTFVYLTETFPAGFVLEIGYTAALDPEEAAAILQKAKAAGVRALLEAYGADESEMLILDNTDGPGLDVGYLADYWE
jgi:hypothetical protein